MASSDLMRLSGINSGYDTESMIEAMMTSYQTKIDTQQKKLTKLSWQQEAYRDITTKLTDFKNKYFDILKRDTYLMSPTSFNKLSSKVTNNGTEATGGLKVLTTAGSLQKDYKISVSQLATASTAKGKTLTPANFSLDLDKAADNSLYETKTLDSGETARNYSFELDVQVGSVTKTVSFDVEAVEASDGSIDMDAFKASAVESLNKSLQDAFGLSGRSGAEATGQTNADGKEWFIQAKTDADGKLAFDIGGNATATVTEKTGNFGLAAESSKLAYSAASAVTGENTVSVSINGVSKNVTFNGVSDTYYVSKNASGNEAIKLEYDQLKAAAYRKANNLSDSAVVSQSDLDAFSYSTAQAAKDKNTKELQAALNDAFKGESITFTADGSYITAKKGGATQSFSMTSVDGGTLGLTKGTATNKYSSKTTLEEMGIKAFDDGVYSFKINGEKITLSADATMNDLVNAVNKSGAGVTMTYSALTNSFDIKANDMGSGSNIEIEANDIADALGLTENGSVINLTEGQNAIIEIDGQKVYHNSNSYTVDGTTFSFDEEMKLGETYNVSLSKNYDDIKQTIKDFVKDYNQLIDDVYGHIGTSPKRDDKNNTYEPLTDAEKEEMSEDEIEKLEKAAKQGVIYNDSTVSNIMLNMRTVLYTGVDTGNGKFGLFSMGIKASSDYSDHGKLEIDEDALDEAFEKYADEITTLFTDTDNGIMRKLNNVIDGAVRTTSTNRGSLIQKAGLEKGNTATDNYIYRQMKSVTDRISQLQKRYDAKEEYWWGVFTNLESMMSDLNSQSSYLSSYFGSGTYV